MHNAVYIARFLLGLLDDAGVRILLRFVHALPAVASVLQLLQHRHLQQPPDLYHRDVTAKVENRATERTGR